MKATDRLTRSNQAWPPPFRAQAHRPARLAQVCLPVKAIVVTRYAMAFILTAVMLAGAELRFHPNDSAPAIVGSDAPKEGRHQDIRGGVQLGDDLVVYSTASTNAKTGAVSLTDTYTRGGMTNLIRSTRLEEGNVAARIHRLYRDGERLAIVSEVRGQLGIQTMAESAFHLDFIFHADRTINGVGVMSADGTIVDLLTATNMVLSPISSPDLRKAQHVGADVQRLFEDVEAKSPAQFRREAQDLIEKHDE
jgi:hypothetical protein